MSRQFLQARHFWPGLSAALHHDDRPRWLSDLAIISQCQEPIVAWYRVRRRYEGLRRKPARDDVHHAASGLPVGSHPLAVHLAAAKTALKLQSAERFYTSDCTGALYQA